MGISTISQYQICNVQVLLVVAKQSKCNNEELPELSVCGGGGGGGGV